MRILRLSLLLACGLPTLSVGTAQEDTSGQPAAPVLQESAPALSWPRLDELSATRDRPLFTPDRRREPPPRPTATVFQPPQPRPQFALKGIVAEGTATFVVLEDMNSSESIVVRAGEKMGDWRVTIDTERSVRLIGEGEEIKLQMFEEEPGISK
jgi:general secretion pathway protein N